jgi:ADP-ribose pyrophosphatase YjhB (NUDIX family)
LSYLKPSDIAEIEEVFGIPRELYTDIKMTPRELLRLRQSQVSGRAHDVTLFIFKDDKMLFTAKHFYPPGLYRAPSGAVRPGESIIEGAKREALEETGAKIELEKYLLRIRVKFFCGDDYINWTSHVFKAKYVSGEIRPQDTKEIREARFIEKMDIERFNEIMLKLNIGGFRYRVFLTKNTLKLLDEKM